MNRRQLLALSATAILSPLAATRANAIGGTAAISTPITGPVRLRMRATSLAKDTHWGIYVQEVVVTDGKISPTALIACFEFGRKGDPAVFPELLSAPLPLIAPPGAPYRVAVYFFEGREVTLQPHSDAAMLANHFDLRLDPQGRTAAIKASSFGSAELPMANVHEISILFEYPA